MFYLSHFTEASPNNNSQMSHLITQLASYVAAHSLAARNARSTSSCHIFHERVHIGKDTKETLTIEYHGESRLALSS